MTKKQPAATQWGDLAPFTLTLGDVYQPTAPGAVRVFAARLDARNCRIGIREREGELFGNRVGGKKAEVILTSADMRALAADLLAKAQEIDDAIVAAEIDHAENQTEHDHQAAPTATTGGDA